MSAWSLAARCRCRVTPATLPKVLDFSHFVRWVVGRLGMAFLLYMYLLVYTIMLMLFALLELVRWVLRETTLEPLARRCLLGIGSRHVSTLLAVGMQASDNAATCMPSPAGYGDLVSVAEGVRFFVS